MLPFQDYVMASPLYAHGHLLCALELVQDAFPDAAQRMYHRLPSYFYGKRDIINVGAYKDHLGLHLGPAVMAYLRREYPAYRYTKTTIKLPYAEPFPVELVKDICSKIKEME